MAQMKVYKLSLFLLLLKFVGINSLKFEGQFQPDFEEYIDVDITNNGRYRRDTTLLPLHPETFDIKFFSQGQKVSLTLHRNQDIAEDVDVYVQQGDDIILQQLRYDQNTALYQDIDNGAAFMVEFNDTHIYNLFGTLHVKEEEYMLEKLLPSSVESAPSKTKGFKLSKSRTDELRYGDFVLREDSRLKFSEMNDVFNNEKSNRRFKRSVTHYTVELLIVVDYSVYKFWYDKSNATSHVQKDTDAKTSIRQFYAFVMNSIDMRYKSIQSASMSISVVFAGIYISDQASNSPWTETIKEINGSSIFVDSTNGLNNFQAWVNSTSGLPSHDHAMLFTKYDLTGSSGASNAGLATLSAVCKTAGQSIVEDSFHFGMMTTAAHELGHSLGAVHDGDGNTCSGSDYYVMAAISGVVEGALKTNPWQFSNCSVDDFEKYITSLNNDNSNCMTTLSPNYDPTALTPYDSQQPGQVYSVQTQCQYSQNDNTSDICRSFYNGSYTGVCNKLYCSRSGSNSCRAYAAAERTTCGDKKWCVGGECVSSNDAPSATDNCPFGDQPGVITSGFTCLQIAQMNAYNCENFNRRCCATCNSLYTGVAGCEYGDKLPKCVAANCDLYTNDTKAKCCSTCADSITTTEAETTTTLSSTTTELPTTTTAPTTTTLPTTTTTASTTTTLSTTTTTIATTTTLPTTTTAIPTTTTRSATTTTTIPTTTTTMPTTTTTTIPTTTTTTIPTTTITTIPTTTTAIPTTTTTSATTTTTMPTTTTTMPTTTTTIPTTTTTTIPTTTTAIPTKTTTTTPTTTTTIPTTTTTIPTTATTIPTTTTTIPATTTTIPIKTTTTTPTTTTTIPTTATTIPTTATTIPTTTTTIPTTTTTIPIKTTTTTPTTTTTIPTTATTIPTTTITIPTTTTAIPTTTTTTPTTTTTIPTTTTTIPTTTTTPTKSTTIPTTTTTIPTTTTTIPTTTTTTPTKSTTIPTTTTTMHSTTTTIPTTTTTIPTTTTTPTTTTAIPTTTTTTPTTATTTPTTTTTTPTTTTTIPTKTTTIPTTTTKTPTTSTTIPTTTTTIPNTTTTPTTTPPTTTTTAPTTTTTIPSTTAVLTTTTTLSTTSLLTTTDTPSTATQFITKISPTTSSVEVITGPTTTTERDTTTSDQLTSSPTFPTTETTILTSTVLLDSEVNDDTRDIIMIAVGAGAGGLVVIGAIALAVCMKLRQLPNKTPLDSIENGIGKRSKSPYMKSNRSQHSSRTQSPAKSSHSKSRSNTPSRQSGSRSATPSEVRTVTSANAHEAFPNSTYAPSGHRWHPNFSGYTNTNWQSLWEGEEMIPYNIPRPFPR